MRLFEIARLDMTAALPFRLCAAGILGRGKAAKPGPSADAAAAPRKLFSSGGPTPRVATFAKEASALARLRSHSRDAKSADARIVHGKKSSIGDMMAQDEAGMQSAIDNNAAATPLPVLHPHFSCAPGGEPAAY